MAASSLASRPIAIRSVGCTQASARWNPPAELIASRSGIAQLEQQQQMQQAPAVPAQSDLAARLTELKTLHDQGVLTDDEFAAAKQKRINES